MSNQHNDQDEQQTPSGEASRGAGSAPGERRGGAEGGQPGGSSRRSRRRGKGGGNSAAASSPPSSDAAKGGAESKPASGSKDPAGKQDKGQASKPAAAKASSGQGGGSVSPGGGGGQGGGKAGALALGLVILLGAGGAAFGWQVWQKLDAQQQRLAALPSQIADQGALDALEDRLESGERERNAALDEAVSSLRGEFNDYRQSVDETLDKVLAELSSEQQTDEREWLHAEAAYLLRLANQRLQLERDVQGAAALLRTADERLREADNPALVPVRREIASELAALDAVPRVDRTGLYLALNAQQERIAGLPLAQDIEQIAADATLEEPPSGAWQQQLARFGEELKDLVTVRRHDEALEALISPEQESYLRQSVRLVLEQAQLALLKEEQALFDASLDKALTLIGGYYDTDHDGVQAVLSRLEELKGRSIRPELPDISGSQQALASFIERRFEAGADGQGDEA